MSAPPRTKSPALQRDWRLDMNDERVLVTGGSGFIGGHCIAELIQAGYRVHTTIRSSAREADVRTMVAARGVVGRERLTFTVADLTSDDGWPEAVADCDYVLHVASPFPPDDPEHEGDVIVPARDGTLRVLRAARDAGIRRGVLTSSFAPVGYGHGTLDREFTEGDWTNLDGRGITVYVKSKGARRTRCMGFHKQRTPSDRAHGHQPR